MLKINWFKGLWLHVYAPGICFAVMPLALTEVPVAIKTSAEIYYMEMLGKSQGPAVGAMAKFTGG